MKKMAYDEIKQEISNYVEYLAEKNTKMLGYPVNLDYDYSTLFDTFKYSINNIGDPYVEHDYKLHSKEYERKVIDFYRKLYKLPARETWGYVTSGGTEGNMYGLFIGRELLRNPILYYSGDTHYSVRKLGRILNIDSEVVGTTDDGVLHYDDLKNKIKKNAKRPVLINLNIGTTVKGGIDDIEKVVTLLESLGIKKYYIHCDAALFGGYLPMIKNPHIENIARYADSISISGHKFIGTPIPCGVILTKDRQHILLSETVEYIGTTDTTILGSRSGHTALMLWQAISMKGVVGLTKDAKECINNAIYLKERLQDLDIGCVLNEYSNIVIFDKPKKSICQKWQLSVQGRWAHIVVMPHVRKPVIDEFILDLQ